MSHSFNKIWIHAIWSTKNRAKLINPKIESVLFQFIRNQFQELTCPVRIINGISDHIHCLYQLNPQKANAAIIKQIKGSRSHFLNQGNLLAEKFAWQTGYAAFSVSESAIEKVFKYIKKQKQHHQKQSLQAEYEEFVKLHNIQN
jgi:REP element-mobilizing transposase RayT